MTRQTLVLMMNFRHNHTVERFGNNIMIQVVYRFNKRSASLGMCFNNSIEKQFSLVKSPCDLLLTLIIL